MPVSTSAGLDVRGASNTPCTIIVSNDHATLTWQIDAPNPPVADTSLTSRAPLATICDQADASTAGVAPAGGVSATRTSTQLCFTQQNLMGTFGGTASSTPNCPVSLTLTCAGVTLYDRVPWEVCGWFG